MMENLLSWLVASSMSFNVEYLGHGWRIDVPTEDMTIGDLSHISAYLSDNNYAAAFEGNQIRVLITEEPPA